MKKGCKIALVGGLAVVVGIAACWKWMIRMPLGEFTRYALYMAVLDDEICRNELEGNQIGDQVISFAPRAETLQGRYHLFLELNRTKDREQLMKPDAIICHPGPMNRGMEINADVADCARSRILDQVNAGVLTRMAEMYLLLGGEDHGMSD